MLKAAAKLKGAGSECACAGFFSSVCRTYFYCIKRIEMEKKRPLYETWPAWKVKHECLISLPVVNTASFDTSLFPVFSVSCVFCSLANPTRTIYHLSQQHSMFERKDVTEARALPHDGMRIVN